MTFEHLNRRYEIYLQSDSERDGMALELMDETEHPHGLVLEVFYADVGNRLTLTAFHKDIAVELVERVISEARIRLPPAINR